MHKTTTVIADARLTDSGGYVQPTDVAAKAAQQKFLHPASRPDDTTPRDVGRP